MSSIVGRTITRGPVAPPALCCIWDAPGLVDGAAVVPATAATDNAYLSVGVGHFLFFFLSQHRHHRASCVPVLLSLPARLAPPLRNLIIGTCGWTTCEKNRVSTSGESHIVNVRSRLPRDRREAIRDSEDPCVPVLTFQALLAIIIYFFSEE